MTEDIQYIISGRSTPLGELANPVSACLVTAAIQEDYHRCGETTTIPKSKYDSHAYDLELKLVYA